MEINSPTTPVFRFSHDALATSNHINIAHEDEAYAGQAARAAFREIDRLESMLSRFEEGSDIWQLNHTQSTDPIPVSLETYECLAQSMELTRLTNGAFDVTIGNLYELWSEEEPDEETIEAARNKTGAQHISLATNSCAVSVSSPGIMLDLGAVGKGYILDKVATILEEWELPRALLNSGGSTILALDSPSPDEDWKVTCGEELVELTQMAASGSGVAYQGEHIIDPRTGRPATARKRCWALAPTATIADAMSTAAMVMTLDERRALQDVFPAVSFMDDRRNS